MLVQVKLDLRQEMWAQSMCALELTNEAIEEAVHDMTCHMIVYHVAME